MKYEGINLEKKASYAIADLMVLAAKTAPKGRGADNIVTLVIDGKEKDDLADEMRKIAKEMNSDVFVRDAGNVDNSYLAVLVGVKDNPVGLSCGFCGFKNCAELKKSGGRCAFNITDLGIALGSAVSVAANHRIDNRIMFTVGKATQRLKFFADDVKICFGILLSSSSKSIFFDRSAAPPPINLDKK